MTLDKIHNLFDLLSDKEKTGYFTPGEKDIFIDRASIWLFNSYEPRYAFDVEAQEALASFRKKLDFVTGSNGILTVSSLGGYEEYSSVRGIEVSVVDVTYGTRKWNVDIIKENEISDRKNSQLLTPSATRPICEETASGVFEFTPAQVHAGTIRYLKKPKTPVFVYSMVGRTVTYNSGSSVQLEWTDVYLNKVIFKALALAGFPLSNQSLIELGLTLPKEKV